MAKKFQIATQTLMLLAALGFGWLNFWQLFEQDAFWLVRAGEEILEAGRIPSLESWTHTVDGKPWTHFQWLSSVFFHFAHSWAGGLEGLVWLRSILTVILFLLIGGLIRRCAGYRPERQWIQLMWFFPWFYLMNWLRMQLRPDFFGLIFFAIVLLLQMRADFSSRRIRSVTLGVLLLWANFHAGTVVFGIAVFVASVVFSPSSTSWVSRLLWVSAGILSWFATPVHIKILEVARIAAKIQNNPDLQPFHWNLLLYSEGGWTYSLLFVFLIFAGVGVFVNGLRGDARLSGAYRSSLFVLSLIGLMLILFFERIRAIPYLTLFALPLAVTGCDWMMDRLAIGKRQILLYASALIVGGIFWGWMIPDQKKINLPLGASVSPQWMPVESAKFVKENKPLGQLYNHFNFGGYLIYALREYPVFHDGRETPFVELDRARREAMATPEKWDRFLRGYNVNVVIDRLPQGGEENALFAKFYPSSDWARVYSDFVSTVYLRRIDEHYELIKQYGKTGGMPKTTNNRPNLSEQEIKDLIRQAEEEIRRRNTK
ncbi:MAG: hypothetical protein NDI61_05320 [Bdellovibrionaceae bacterium]|nr:hypothetical protein [Pseudobdellovibrionaceae bacterium]